MCPHHAILYVKDLERMKGFYGEILDVAPTNQNQTNVWACFETDGARLALHANPVEIAKEIEIKSPPAPREQSPLKLVFEVTDVESLRARLESLGAQILRRTWQNPREACDVVDPEGNIFQLCSPTPSLP